MGIVPAFHFVLFSFFLYTFTPSSLLGLLPCLDEKKNMPAVKELSILVKTVIMMQTMMLSQMIVMYLKA